MGAINELGVFDLLKSTYICITNNSYQYKFRKPIYKSQ